MSSTAATKRSATLPDRAFHSRALLLHTLRALPGGIHISSTEGGAYPLPALVARDGLHAPATDVVPPALRFRSPQSVDAPQLLGIKALDKEIREPCAGCARQFQGLLSQSFDACRHGRTICDLVPSLNQFPPPLDNPNKAIETDARRTRGSSPSRWASAWKGNGKVYEGIAIRRCTLILK